MDRGIEACRLSRYSSTSLFVVQLRAHTGVLSIWIVGLLDVESEIDHSMSETTVERTNGRPLFHLSSIHTFLILSEPEGSGDGFVR